jgi:hypothetical protein
MALAQIGKQLVQQVVSEKMNDVMDSLRPPDAGKIVDAAKQEKAPVAAPNESLGAIIIGQIQAMQAACKEDQELVVLCNAGLETLRVLEFFAPAPQVLVMTGIDTDRNVTRVVSPVGAAQLVAKVMPVKEGAKPARVTFRIPQKPK